VKNVTPFPWARISDHAPSGQRVDRRSGRGGWIDLRPRHHGAGCSPCRCGVHPSGGRRTPRHLPLRCGRDPADHDDRQGGCPGRHHHNGPVEWDGRPDARRRQDRHRWKDRSRCNDRHRRPDGHRRRCGPEGAHAHDQASLVDADLRRGDDHGHARDERCGAGADHRRPDAACGDRATRRSSDTRGGFLERWFGRLLSRVRSDEPGPVRLGCRLSLVGSIGSRSSRSAGGPVSRCGRYCALGAAARVRA
jgi:hypothetical protein